MQESGGWVWKELMRLPSASPGSVAPDEVLNVFAQIPLNGTWGSHTSDIQ